MMHLCQDIVTRAVAMSLRHQQVLPAQMSLPIASIPVHIKIVPASSLHQTSSARMMSSSKFPSVVFRLCRLDGVNVMMHS